MAISRKRGSPIYADLSAYIGWGALGHTFSIPLLSALLLLAVAPLFARADAPERYQIVKGDTLFGISKRFFGDGMAWPKLHEWNKDTISNPDLIYPDKWIVFQPGTANSLPKLAVQAHPADSANEIAEPAPHDRSSGDKIKTGSAKTRSEEWRQLPKQPWESTPAALPPNVDAYGFDRDNKLHFSKARGFDLEAIAATERVTTLGQIVGARSGAEYLSLGDTVYIRADEDIQLGETYALTQEPSVLKSRKSDRVGYSYLILGKVKIIGVRDDLFIGTIVAGHRLIARGNDLITNPPKVPALNPIAAPSATEGVIMLDKNLSSFFSAQHKLIFIDRGSADGIRAGMVFRAYEHYDLSNEKKITSSDFIIDADAMVVQVSDRFCVATVINSLVPITENSTAALLTDISDLSSHRGFRGAGGSEKNSELDELDKLDGGTGLGKDEQKELEQLEKWKGNPQGGAGASANTPPPPPPTSDDPGTPPPPPPENGSSEITAPPPAPSSSSPSSPSTSGDASNTVPPPPPAADDPGAPPPPPPFNSGESNTPVPTATTTPLAPVAGTSNTPPPPPPAAPTSRTPSPKTPVDSSAPTSNGGPSQESQDLDRLLNQ